MNMIPASLAKLCMNAEQRRIGDLPIEAQDLMRHFKQYAEIGWTSSHSPEWGPFQYEGHPMFYGVYRLDCSRIGFWSSVWYLIRRCV